MFFVIPQLLGFTMVSILFFISAGAYPWLTQRRNTGLFEFIYYFSSFWGQFGPNCTTWLLAGMHSALSALCSKCTRYMRLTTCSCFEPSHLPSVRCTYRTLVARLHRLEYTYAEAKPCA